MTYYCSHDLPKSFELLMSVLSIGYAILPQTSEYKPSASIRSQAFFEGLIHGGGGGG